MEQLVTLTLGDIRDMITLTVLVTLLILALGMIVGAVFLKTKGGISV
ncbi:MAG: hypothetical protein WC479_05770 [Candidatus Izemoplasmatales bacterium]